jgi:RsiW-degrading membrane proteinase PrsW (M82 family)
MYWIDILLLLSFASLLGWLGYGFVDSVQRNDSRTLMMWTSVTGAVIVIVALLVFLDVLLPDGSDGII